MPERLSKHGFPRPSERPEIAGNRRRKGDSKPEESKVTSVSRDCSAARIFPNGPTRALNSGDSESVQARDKESVQCGDTNPSRSGDKESSQYDNTVSVIDNIGEEILRASLAIAEGRRLVVDYMPHDTDKRGVMSYLLGDIEVYIIHVRLCIASS